MCRISQDAVLTAFKGVVKYDAFGAVLQLAKVVQAEMSKAAMPRFGRQGFSLGLQSCDVVTYFQTISVGDGDVVCGPQIEFSVLYINSSYGLAFFAQNTAVGDEDGGYALT